MSIPILIVALYLVITTAVSLYYTRKNKNSKQFFVAERSFTAPIIVALIFSEFIAGSSTVGNVTQAFKVGLTSVWSNWGMTLGAVLFVIFTCKFFYSMGSVHGVMSMPEAYNRVFDSKCRVVLLLIVSLVYFIIFVTQPAAAAGILGPMFGIDPKIMLWICTVLFIISAVTGGMKGLAKMNIVHSLVLYISMGIICFKSVHAAGGIANLHAVLPETYFSIAQPNLVTILGQVIGTACSFLASANLVSVAVSAKSYQATKRGSIIAALVIVPFALLPAFIGLSAKVVMPDANPSSVLYAMASSFGPAFSGIASMGVIAAIWSTAPALLLIVSTTLTRDLYKAVLRPDSTDREQLVFSKVCIVILGVLGALLSMKGTSIFSTLLSAFQIRAIVGIVLTAALLWPRVNSTSAFWSMLLGGIVAAGWFFAGSPLGLPPFWPGFIVTMVILIPLTLCSKEKVSPGYRLYRETIHGLDTPAAQCTEQ